MMRREVLERSGGYRTRDWRAEDASLWTRLTSFGFRAAKVTEESTLIYRFRQDSKSADEARAHQDRDGDWTAWYPWRTAGDPYDGLRAIQEKRQPNPRGGAVRSPRHATAPAALLAGATPSGAAREHHHSGRAGARRIPDRRARQSVQAQTLPKLGVHCRERHGRTAERHRKPVGASD
jgi:hypothetical protein